MCPSQTQDPLAIQGKHINHLESLRLNQDKLCLAPKVRSFPPSTMPDGKDRPSRLDLPDWQINPVKSSGFLACVVNHAWCLSTRLAAWLLSAGLDDWCLSIGLVAWCLSVGLATWRLSYTVRDFGTIVNTWHQLAALTWYDCPIHVIIMALTIHAIVITR